MNRELHHKYDFGRLVKACEGANRRPCVLWLAPLEGGTKNVEPRDAASIIDPEADTQKMASAACMCIHLLHVARCTGVWRWEHLAQSPLAMMYGPLENGTHLHPCTV